MTDSALLTIFGLMGTGIAGEFGLIVWFIKTQRTAADAQIALLQARVKELESRQDGSLQSLATLVAAIPTTMQTIVEVTREIKMQMQIGGRDWQRADRGEGR